MLIQKKSINTDAALWNINSFYFFEDLGEFEDVPTLEFIFSFLPGK